MEELTFNELPNISSRGFLRPAFGVHHKIIEIRIQPIPFVMESNVLHALRVRRTNQRFHIRSRFDALLDSAHSIAPIRCRIAVACSPSIENSA